MKRGGLLIIAFAAICVVVSGPLSLAGPTDKSGNSSISGSEKSGSSGGTKTPQKTSSKPTIKSSIPEPIGKKPPTIISPPSSQKKIALFGFCCKDGELKESSKEVCISKVRGKFFGSKPEADRFCNSQKGWCCEGGKITRKNRSECSKKSQVFLTSNMLALQSCKPEKGFCNDDERTLRLTEVECTKRKGSYFAVQSQAVLDLTRTKQKKRLAASREQQQKKSIGAADRMELKKTQPMSLKPDKDEVVPGKTSPGVQDGFGKKGKGSSDKKGTGLATFLGVESRQFLRTKGEGDIQVVEPNGGEHWESCTVGYPKWRYYGDPATMPTEFIVEYLRDGAREFMIRSRCTDYTDHGGEPSYRECVDRSPKPCMATGNYLVKVSGGGTSDHSNATFRIGISEDWPMIALSSPLGGRTYARGGDLPIRYHTYPPEVDLGMVIYKGDTPITRMIEPGATGMDYGILDSFADGDDYWVRVFQPSNPENFVESGMFTIGGRLNDLYLHSTPFYSHGDGNLIASIIADTSGGEFFSGPLTFRIERLEPSYQSWTVTRDIHFSSGHELVNLGDMNLPTPEDLSRRCYLQYRVTVDADNVYQEFREDNNSESYPVNYSGRPGKITYQQAGTTNPPTLTCAETGDFRGEAPEFSVMLQICGPSRSSGSIRILQTGRWPDEPGATPTSQELLLYRGSISIGEPPVRTVRIDGSSPVECFGSTIEIYHYGDFESWHSSNPIRIGLLPE